MLAKVALVTLAVLAATPEEGVYRARVAAPDGLRFGLYRYVAPAPQRTVLLFPDVGMNHHAFDLHGTGLARFLKDHGAEVWTVEYRGAGIADVPFGGFTLEELLKNDGEAAFAKALEGHARITVGGVGFGATLALLLAARHPEKVDSVLALQPVLTLDVPNDPVAKALASLSDAPAWLDVEELSRRSMHGRRSWFEVMLDNDGGVDAEVATDFQRRALSRLPKRFVEQAAAFAKARRIDVEGAPLTDALKGWRGPTFVAFAPRDNWIHPEFATPVRDALGREHIEALVLNRVESGSLDYGHLGLLHGHRIDRDLFFPLLKFLAAHGGEP